MFGIIATLLDKQDFGSPLDIVKIGRHCLRNRLVGHSPALQLRDLEPKGPEEEGLDPKMCPA